MLRTEFGESSFDAIVTNKTTMYVDLFDLFSEFARIIKPGGRYVFITWCVNDAVTAASPDVAAIDRHYGSRMHPRSEYFAALAQNGFTPYQVADLTARAIPYWELRTYSEHRTGVEDSFLAAYRNGAMSFVLAGTQHTETSV
jgi:geranyl diphosphate 2-C-methyltransferase